MDLLNVSGKKAPTAEGIIGKVVGIAEEAKRSELIFLANFEKF